MPFLAVTNQRIYGFAAAFIAGLACMLLVREIYVLLLYVCYIYHVYVLFAFSYHTFWLVEALRRT